MTNTELNTWIAENIMGECLHPRTTKSDGGLPDCLDCSAKEVDHQPDDYCNSLDAVAKAVNLVVERVGIERYARHLYKVVNGTNVVPGWAEMDFKQAGNLATAHPTHQVWACKEAWESK